MQGEADALAIGAEANIGVEEIVTGLLIPAGAFSATLNGL